MRDSGGGRCRASPMIREPEANVTVTPCSALIHPLSPRELEVLRHVAHGDPNKIIACQLGISIQTVHNHVRLAMAKLQARCRTEAVVKAIQIGILPLWPQESPATSKNMS